MNAVESRIRTAPPPLNYWRLWLFDTVLVSAGLLFFLAAQYGTCQFFGAACLMALLPFIPALVLVGGAGSTVFALTRVMIEKHSLNRPAALVLLVVPALMVLVLFLLLAAFQSPGHRLAYICFGNAPASASQVRVAGYSTFLREEWLGAFNVGRKDFQTMVAKGRLAPADSFEFRKALDQSSFNGSKLLQGLPQPDALPCYKRDFKPGEDHERGNIYALFDPATSTAVVLREYRD